MKGTIMASELEIERDQLLMIMSTEGMNDSELKSFIIDKMLEAFVNNLTLDQINEYKAEYVK